MTSTRPARSLGLAGVAAALIFGCLVLIPGGSAATGSLTPGDREFLARGLGEMHDVLGLSGATVAIKGGRVVFRGAFGARDQSTGEPITPETRFRINGLTEALNWIALLHLRDLGKIDLDASICRYFADCPRSWRSVRVRDLMGLSSGLRPVARAELHVPATLNMYLDRLRTKPLGFTPGTIIASNATRFYSGSSPAVLAARLLEIVSGQAWEAALRRLVFAPARMSSTGLSRDGHSAKGYGIDSGGRFAERPLPRSLLTPDVEAGLWSSAADFGRLELALQSGQFLSASSLEELNTPLYARDRRRGTGPSCCWIVGRTFGHDSQIIGGHGSGDGFYTVVERYPQDSLAVFSFSNVGANRPAFAAADFISSVLLASFPPIVHVPAQILRSLPGIYVNSRYRLRLRVELHGNNLRVTEASPGWSNVLGTLLPIGGRSFVAGFSPAQTLAFGNSNPATQIRYTAIFGSHRFAFYLSRSH